MHIERWCDDPKIGRIRHTADLQIDTRRITWYLSNTFSTRGIKGASVNKITNGGWVKKIVY